MPTPDLPADAPRVADGRYVLLTRLGEGGMAVVYGAWDTQLRVWRAVKVLLPEHARRRSVRRRFEREARTLMTIRHPNLVRVHEVRADRALPYLVMDLLPGGSLEDWVIRHGAMPPALAVRAASEVALALEAAHTAGVIHRDVKPQNVLVDVHDSCCLTDFGVARVEGGGGTRTNVSMGTVGYMAPEQLADSKSVDPRSDVYSLGASLYVLVTRRPVRDLFRVSDDPSLLDDLPAPLRDVLRRCLAYERQDRWPSAAAAYEALVAAIDALPPAPTDTPPLGRRRTDDAPIGGATGELTELEGLLEAPIPQKRKKKPAEPDTEETPLTPLYSPPVWAAKVPDPAPLRRVLHAPPAPATPPPEPVGRPLAAAAAGTVALAGMLGVAIAAIGTVAGALLASSGGQLVATEAASAAAAERIVVQRVHEPDELVADLRRLGIEDAEAGALAAGEPRAFAHAVARAARSGMGGRRDDADDELARQRLERVVWAVDRLDQAEASWASAADAPLGRLAVWLGWAEGPG
ncbi:MAG: serine/threonine-protein kinase [Myxococcota bacterium]